MLAREGDEGNGVIRAHPATTPSQTNIQGNLCSLAVEWSLLVLDQVLRGIQRVLDVIGLVWLVGSEDWINQAIHSNPISLIHRV